MRNQVRRLRLIVGTALIALSTQSCQRKSAGHEPQPLVQVNQSTVNSSPATAADNQLRIEGMILINGGRFLLGTEEGMSYEAPVHEVTVKSFWMDRHEVTVGEFAKFVAATGYKTDAERFGWSGTFDLKSGAWKKTRGANWRHPDGPGSEAASNEPVCQVSWSDAAAYAKWAGKRLPTEAEWEYAARGRLTQMPYAWGREFRPAGRFMANSWQGTFPSLNTKEDGWEWTSPVASFPANGFGLYDMAGNVWEWCSDWYRPDYYARSPRRSPPGPADSSDPAEPGTPKRVQRGGSFLCTVQYCSRYMPGGRGKCSPDTGSSHAGFRC